ncbi:MAG: HEPN domain-containing protein [Victivallaceae bacterium]|nr:HEPN domain-containing protein [Victivallaceae bacterium]
MPSIARKSLDENLVDAKRLIELHQKEGGNLRGRRYGLEVLNKSAIVLITSYWEAYCEDIAAEALEHIIEFAASSDNLPSQLKKQIASELKKDENELAIWEISDDKWKGYLKLRLSNLQISRNRKLNTPKTDNIDQLFESAVGISKVSSSWSWPRMTVKQASEKLDRFVTLRGTIAHRGTASTSVTKTAVVDYLDLIRTLASKTGGKVNSHVNKITGRPLWKKRVKIS